MQKIREKPVLFTSFFVFVVISGIYIITMVLTAGREDADDLPVFNQIPSFELINQHSEKFGLENLNGKIWVANFIFTNCGGICPSMSFNMGKLHNTISPDLPVKFVSFSVDPNRDTPEMLLKYGERYDADHSRWFFLTGTEEIIHSLSRDSFRMGVDTDGGVLEEPILHSQRMVLIDRDGKIRGYYTGIDDDVIPEIISDIFKLLDS